MQEINKLSWLCTHHHKITQPISLKYLFLLSSSIPVKELDTSKVFIYDTNVTNQLH